MDLVKHTISVALLAFASGCINLGADAAWTPITQITGDLAPQTGAAATTALIASPDTVRIVTYNIRDGGVAPAEIAAAFAANPNLARADVVFIQEAEAFPEEVAPRIATLAAVLDTSWIYAPARAEKTGTLGDAILSRYPIDNFEVIDLPLATLKRQRIAVGADLHVGGQILRVVSTQLDTSLNISNRVRQLHPVVIDLPTAALVGGDFNTNPFAWQDGIIPLVGAEAIANTDQAPMIDNYMSGLGFANPTAGRGNTEVRYGISSRLDAVYARGVEIVGGGVERNVLLSDHYPTWIDVRLVAL